jgi:hypothetical protein
MRGEREVRKFQEFIGSAIGVFPIFALLHAAENANPRSSARLT